jgi:mannose-6-phosphate isomerase-like protein (cupin superfamily)
MALYKWDDIEERALSPQRSQSTMKLIPAKRMLLLRVLHREDRGDGHAGAIAHSHPEEQIFIALKGTMRIRVGNEWFTMKEGDVVVVPENTEHEEIVDGEFLWLTIKHRIPGHSQDDSWAPGAEEDWNEAKAILDEMDKKYKEKAPGAGVWL